MSEPFRLLILGGTTEASGLVARLVGRHDLAPLLSLAGRTSNPKLPQIPTRIGGFGGPEGLAAFLRNSNIEAVVDATHPFAARISTNAILACRQAKLPLARYTRPPWSREPGDNWISVPSLDAAATAIGPDPRTVLLTSGRLGLAAFPAAPHHRYVIRSIDPPDAAAMPPDSRLILDRGPFSLHGEIGLMRREGVDILVSKNSGGSAAYAKIEAARLMGLRVVMVERPETTGSVPFTTLDGIMGWIEAQRATP